ncbi:MAG: hypothetical protein RL154_1531 [Pseudomonadota bacterium]|jgi:cytochrome b561
MFPLKIRIWHWLNAIVLLGVALTVFLREFWLNKTAVADILTIKLTELNATITNEQAVVIEKAIRAPMWDWHIYLGIAAGVLILFRLFLALKNIKIDDGRMDTKMKAVRMSHVGVMVAIAITVITGLLMVYGGDIGLSKDTRSFLKDIHEPLAWVILAFIPLHIIGVFVSDNTDYKGVVSRIISG